MILSDLGSNWAMTTALNGISQPYSSTCFTITDKQVLAVVNNSGGSIKFVQRVGNTWSDLGSSWNLSGFGTSLRLINYCQISGQNVLILPRTTNSVQFFSRIGEAWSDLGSTWTINTGLNVPVDATCSTMFGLSDTLIIPNFTGNTILFRKRVGNTWSDLGSTWNITTGLSGPTHIEGCTINGQDVLIVVNQSSSTILFRARVGNAWSDLGSTWNITTGLSLPAYATCCMVAGKNVLIATNSGNNTVSFFERSNNVWINLGSDWNLTNAQGLSQPRDAKCCMISDKYVLSVSNFSASTVQFYQFSPCGVSIPNFSTSPITPTCNSFFDGFYDITSTSSSDKIHMTFTWNSSDYRSDVTPGLNRSFRIQAPSTPGTYPLQLQALRDSDAMCTAMSDVRFLSITVNTFNELTTGWTLNNSQGLNLAESVLYATIDGQLVLGVASLNANNVKFFKRLNGSWSDMGTSWTVSSTNARSIAFATIDCKAVLAVVNRIGGQILFYERTGNAWVSLTTGWTITGLNTPNAIEYSTISGVDVLSVVVNGQVRFFTRSAGTWTELTTNWTISVGTHGINFTTIDNLPVMVVTTFGTNTVRFFQRLVSSWSELTTNWTLTSVNNLNGPTGVRYTKIGTRNVLIVDNFNSNTIRFYARISDTWIEQTTGWTLTNTNNGVNQPIGSVLHTVIDGQDVLVLPNEGNSSVRFYQVCDGYFTTIQGLSTNPLCPCVNQSFTVNWVVGTANGSDWHRAVITVSDQTIISDYVNTNGSAIFAAKTTAGTYPLTLTVQDKLFSDCTDTKSMTVVVNEFTELTAGWTLPISGPLSVVYTTIEGQTLLGVASQNANNVVFFKRNNGTWSDMGTSWRVSTGVNAPRGLFFATIDCKQVLGVGNFTDGLIRFFERTNSTWVPLSDWTISVASTSISALVYDHISGIDVLMVAGFGNITRFYTRSAGTWIELTTGWTTTVVGTNGVQFATIDNLPVLIVSNASANTISFFQRLANSWSQLTTNWTLTASNGLNSPRGVQYTKIGSKNILIVTNNGDNSIRFYERIGGTWVPNIIGWTITSNISFPLGAVNHTVIDNNDVLIIPSTNNNNVRFHQVCEGCFTTIQGLSIDPPCLCASQPFNVNWVVGTANGSDRHTATVTLNGTTFISDYPNSNGVLTLMAPTNGSDYILSLMVTDKLYSDCVDAKALTIHVDKITASNLHGGPVCVDSFLDIFFDVAIQNGGTIARATLNFNGTNYVSDFTPGNNRSFHVLAPSVGSDYTATLIVQDKMSLSCSDVKTATIKVIKTKMSDFQIFPNPVCENQPYTVSWQVDAQGGSTTGVVTINVNGVEYVSDYPIAGGSRILPSLLIESDYTLSISVKDKLYPDCSDSKTGIVHVQAVTVDAGPEQKICLGQSATIGIGFPASNVAYVWTPSDTVSDVTAFPTEVTPLVSTTYTVTATRTDMFDCVANDSVLVKVFDIHLSDVVFTAFTNQDFRIDGFQSGNLPETRFVDVDYLGVTYHYPFNTDGSFGLAFTNVPISDGEPIFVRVYYSDNPSCSDVTSTITHPNNLQGIVRFQLTGSSLNFDLALTPDVSAALSNTTDTQELLSDLCTLINTKSDHRILAGINLVSQTDVFSGSNVIETSNHIVVIMCSDNTLSIDEISGLFSLNLAPIDSPNLSIVYNDGISSVTKSMTVSNIAFDIIQGQMIVTDFGLTTGIIYRLYSDGFVSIQNQSSDTTITELKVRLVTGVLPAGLSINQDLSDLSISPSSDFTINPLITGTPTEAGIFPISFAIAGPVDWQFATISTNLMILTYYPTTSDRYRLTLCGCSSDMVMVVESDISDLIFFNDFKINDTNGTLAPYKTLAPDIIPVIEVLAGIQSFNTITILFSDLTFSTYTTLNTGEQRSSITSDYQL